LPQRSEYLTATSPLPQGGLGAEAARCSPSPELALLVKRCMTGPAAAPLEVSSSPPVGAVPPTSAHGESYVSATSQDELAAKFERIAGGAASRATSSVEPLIFNYAAEPDPPAYLVDHLLERQTVNVLSGDTGSGKSIVTASLAVAICMGSGEWLGREVYTERVLVVDEENPERLVKARLYALGLRDDHTDKLRYFSRQGFAIGTPEWTERLRTEALEHGADLVIIDTAAAATCAKTNDNDDVAGLYRDLRLLATDLDLAVVLLHHERKPQPGQPRGDRGQAMMGARAWATQADCHVALRPHVAVVETPFDGGKQELHFELVLSTPKVRDGSADIPVVVAIDSTKDQAGRLLFMSVTKVGRLVPEPSKQQTIIDAVAALLADRGELPRSEIEQALEVPHATLERALKLAKDEGIITSPRRGSYALPASI
jgi:AAA domain